MPDRNFLKKIYNNLPNLDGQLRIDYVDYQVSKNSAVVFFTSDVLINADEFKKIRKLVRQSFSQMNITVRIASPSLAEDFLENPEKYRSVIEPILQKHYPAMKPFLPDTKWTSNAGRIVLHIPDDFAYEYSSRQDVRQRISDAIYDIFLVRPEIEIFLANAIEERITRLNEERKREEALLSQKLLTSASAAPKKKSKKIVGGKIVAEPVPIKNLTELSGRVVIAGKVIQVEKRNIQKSDSILLLFTLSDLTSSIVCKMFLGFRPNSFYQDDVSSDPEKERRKIDGILSRIVPGVGLKVRGVCQMDSFDNVLTIMARDINVFELEVRKDFAKEKRVELHAHTHMSYMDGMMSVSDLIERAANFGHQAIAVTDHGVVQAFPEAFSAAKKHKIKLIPGMEGLMIDDKGIVYLANDKPIVQTMVVLDFETTGLNPFMDRIVEIGAVKLKNGQIIDSFSSLINPEVPLSEKVIKITGIKDYMLQDQPKAAEVLPKLMEFIGDNTLAAHNAGFDISFLKAELRRMGKEYEPTVVDTLAFSQKLYPQLKRYNLKAICRHLGIILKNAHRAVADATATAQCLAVMLEETRSRGACTLADIDKTVTGYNRNSRHHINILVASQTGMRNLNRLVSQSHIEHFYHEPMIPRDQIIKNREGLILGSSCIEGELYQAVLNNIAGEQLEDIAKFYDYIEIQPLSNYDYLVRNGKITNPETIHAANEILRIGEKLNIPVVATGDVHFLDPEDAIFRTIIKNSLPLEKDGAVDQPPLYLRTTEEMLDEFNWLGEKKAKEIVIDNPAKIANLIGNINLYPEHPEGKTTFAPVWDDAADQIRKSCEERAALLYGTPLPDIVRLRLEKELKAIIGYGYATLYRIAQLLVKKSQEDGYIVGSRGSVGSSFVATMCGITEVNPLPPHYLCTHCHLSQFDVPQGIQTGLDLPDKICKRCGKLLSKDGFDIPFEVFLGFEGDKVPDIDLNFSSEYQCKAHSYVEELIGADNVFRAGTIGTLQEKTAFGYVLKYEEDLELQIPQAEKMRLAQGCIGVKRTTGQHPGGMVILPKGYEINEFTAIQRPANDQESTTLTTHYDFGSMHDILVKVDVLGHDDPTMIRRMEDLSGIHYLSIPLDDPKVLSLFRSPEALGLTSEQLGWSTGTLGIPEFGTRFVRGILDDTQPTTMADLVRISGLSHGTEVWAGNARELILNGTAQLYECICTREDIMLALMERGMDSKIAFDIMERVRKGKGLTSIMEQEMRKIEVPEWFIQSCWKIAYMFPKGHAVAYVTMALRVGWFKIYYPLVYYAAYFSIRGKDFNSLTMIGSTEQIKQELEKLYTIPQRELSDKNEKEIVILELVHEMNLRGFKFLPVDLYKSDATQFLIEGNSLRCPFTSLSGFGVTAAQGIIQTRRENYVSVEDLKNKSKISSACVELLRECGALIGLSDTNQVDFFSLIM